MFRFKVNIQPRVSKTEFAGMHAGFPKIRIAATAVENAANRALVNFVADQLGIAGACVHIVSGHTSRWKVLEIEGMSPDTIAAILGSRPLSPEG